MVCTLENFLLHIYVYRLDKQKRRRFGNHVHTRKGVWSLCSLDNILKFF